MVISYLSDLTTDLAMAASKPVVNSSANIITGSDNNSVAKETRLFSPPDNPG